MKNKPNEKHKKFLFLMYSVLSLAIKVALRWNP